METFVFSNKKRVHQRYANYPLTWNELVFNRFPVICFCCFSFRIDDSFLCEIMGAVAQKLKKTKT